MTENHAKSEVLRGPELRRRWAAAEKIAIMAERHESDVTVSLVARRHGGAEPGVQTQGIKSEDVRDLMVASAESRLGQSIACRAPSNGSATMDQAISPRKQKASRAISDSSRSPRTRS
jgi:transposase-like protein